VDVHSVLQLAQASATSACSVRTEWTTYGKITARSPRVTVADRGNIRATSSSCGLVLGNKSERTEASLITCLLGACAETAYNQSGSY
jgi:hypothetical protein